MYKCILKILIINLFVISAHSQDVSRLLAMKIANNYTATIAPYEREYFNNHIDASKHLIGESINSDTIIENIIEGKYKGYTGYYVITYENGGFVIVSGHKSRGPILGYSFSNKFDTLSIPPALELMLNDYLKIIYRTKDKKIIEKDKISEWTELEEFNISKIYSRLSSNSTKKSLNSSGLWPSWLLTTQWGQSSVDETGFCPGYNAYSSIPPYSGEYEIVYCHHCLAGCVAIATAQLMNFWNYADGDKADFEWWNLPDPKLNISNDNYYDESDAASYLIGRIGEEVDMDYCEEGALSGAMLKCLALDPDCQSNYDAESALVRFGYENTIELKIKSLHTYNSWVNILSNEIEAGRPVLYSFGKHTAVVDGYHSSNDNFHWNFGFDGSFDGYYDFEDLYVSDENGTIDFRDLSKHVCLINISPDIESSKIFDTNVQMNSSDNKTYFVENYIQTTSGSSTFKVEAGSKCWLLAGQLVKMLPGTHIESGSSFLAKIHQRFSATKSLSKSPGNYLPHVEIEDNHRISLNLYPNPNNGHFWIVSDESTEPIYITIFDINGRVVETEVSSERTIEFDLSDVSKGVYIVKVKSNSMNSIRRVLIL